MDSDDESFFITQDVFRQNVDVGESDIDPDFLDWVDSALYKRHEEEIDKSSSSNTRKIAVVSDEELKRRQENRIPQKTKTNTAWCLRTWSEWAKERNAVCSSLCVNERYRVVNSDMLRQEEEELCYWLSKFIVEVRQKKNPGMPYPPNTLYQLACGIQRHLRENGKPVINIFEDGAFKGFQDSLDSEMKRLTGLGVGSDVKQAQPFTEEEEEKLWRLGVLGSDSARVLLDTLVFLIGKNFSLRSGQEHRRLRFSQLTLVEGKGNEEEKLIYCSFGEKNNLGGLKHRGVKAKRIEHYANRDRPERCLVALYKKYLAKCPKAAMEKDSFYVSARRKYEEDDAGSLIVDLIYE